MAKRQKEWARKKRLELMMILGMFCRYCGREDELEFDCIIPQGDDHHKMDTSHRMSFYNKQFKLKNLQVLCGPCNRKKQLEETANIEQPF